jgi:cytochrome c-type protein NapB
VTRGAAAIAAVAVALVATACGGARESAGVHKSPPEQRATRRAYDGAPPVIPHPPLGAGCTSCHNEHGIEVGELGFAPPSPHVLVGDRATIGRCRQCHVFRTTDAEFRASTFVGLPQDLRRGDRMYPGAPPTMPHAVLLRENCAACHDGPAAREPSRTPHPERARGRQCHVPIEAGGAEAADLAVLH